MICFRRTAEDAPVWLLHLESLALARHVREKEGPPCLLGIGRDAPCETALRGLTGALALFLGMDERGAETIPMLNYQDTNWIPPEILVMEPMRGGGFLILQTSPPVFAFGWHPDHDFLGPIWKQPPDLDARENLLRSAFISAFPELRMEGIDETFVDCWFDKPDQIAWPP